MEIERRTTVMLSLCIIMGILAVTLPGQAEEVAEDAEVLQPGMRVYNQNGGQCTLGFAFDGSDGSVYFGWAGHCGPQTGISVRSDGFTFGSVVYTEYPYLNDPSAYDFALIRVDPAHEAKVVGQVKGQPGVPAGVTPSSNTAIGDLVQFSGYGTGYSTTQPTQENRRGVMMDQASDHEYCASGMVHWGDSGGPVVHELSGTALGIVSRLGTSCFPQVSSLTGPTIQSALARAEAAGFDLTLRTA